jgi:hypothetical protein
MLVSEGTAPRHPEEDEMYQAFSQQLAAQHIAELHQEAARQRRLHGQRTRPEEVSRRRAWDRLRWRRRPRPATA